MQGLSLDSQTPDLSRGVQAGIATLTSLAACFLEQLLHHLCRGFGVSLSLDENVQDRSFVGDGTPDPGAFAVNDTRHLVEVPVITGARPRPVQIGSDQRAKLQKPATDGFGGDVQAAFGQHLLNIPKAQGEPGVQPHRVTENVGWEAMTLRGERAHLLSLTTLLPRNRHGQCDDAAGFLLRSAPSLTSDPGVADAMSLVRSDSRRKKDTGVRARSVVGLVAGVQNLDAMTGPRRRPVCASLSAMPGDTPTVGGDAP